MTAQGGLTCDGYHRIKEEHGVFPTLKDFKYQ